MSSNIFPSSSSKPRNASLLDDTSPEGAPSGNASDTEIPVSSMPKQESGTEISANDQSESRSEMRPANSSPSTSYKIPSYVFSRTKSTAPTDWSAASNESLFSIYTGNTSFTMDQYSDLFSGPLLDISSDQTNKPGSIDRKPTLQGQPSIKSTKPIEIGVQPEIQQEKVDELTKEYSLAKGVMQYHGSSHHSDISGSSCKSFAFPVLTRIETTSSKMRSTNLSPRSQSQTPKGNKLSNLNPEQLQSQELEKKPEKGATSATSSVACCPWLSCFTGAPRSWTR